MRGRGIITWLIIAAVLALPLLLCSGAQAADSGCHDGKPTGGSATATGNTNNG